MRGADYGQFPEILDDIEDALDGQENLQELFRTQMVTGSLMTLPTSATSL